MQDKINQLESFIKTLPIVDHHCHNVIDKQPNIELPLAFVLSEGDSINNPLFLNQLKSTLIFKRSIKDIYKFYYDKDFIEDQEENGEIDENIIENEINIKRNEIGTDNIMREVFTRSNIEAIILDDSLKFSINSIELPLKSNLWHSQFTKVYRVIRLETLLEKSLVDAKIKGMTFFVWKSYIEKLYRDTIDHPIDGIKVVGLKSIVAYRCGLGVENPSIQKVLEEFENVINEIQNVTAATTAKTNQFNYRIENKTIINFFIHIAMGVSSTLSRPIPIQIHTGFGDSDLSLELSNPLLLKPLIESYPNVPIVLLHCSYPFFREAGFLSWVYPNVYVDIGLAIPFLSINGMKTSIQSMLELAPIDKIIYSSDSHYIPELFYLGSMWARNIIFKVLSKSLKNNEITLKESKEFAFKIFKTNCLNLYKL
ncbi:hypothetical protein RB653_005460 [Dictyostelium firmibasis]|uniref:Amidohydrolase-related domain-containing protein n=1 Tax=Dictyostelium firmibasis TaxID=79012 RepID=A0AAN7U7P7_9MYCE